MQSRLQNMREKLILDSGRTERTRRDALRANFLRHFLESLAYASLRLRALPVVSDEEPTSALPGLDTPLLLFVGPDAPTGEHVPRGECHSWVITISGIYRTWSSRQGFTFVNNHRDDVALEIALHDTPRSLVYHERRLPMRTRVRVGLDDDPRRRVRDAEV